jgi:hypothetical protein
MYKVPSSRSLFAITPTDFGISESDTFVYRPNFGITDFNSGLISVFHMKACGWSTEKKFIEKLGAE